MSFGRNDSFQPRRNSRAAEPQANLMPQFNRRDAKYAEKTFGFGISAFIASLRLNVRAGNLRRPRRF